MQSILNYYVYSEFDKYELNEITNWVTQELSSYGDLKDKKVNIRINLDITNASV